MRGEFQVGDKLSTFSGIPAGTTIAAIAGNTITLSQNTTNSQSKASLTATETTAPIEWDAPATGSGSLAEALEALAAIGPAGISAGGGPGASGTPFSLTFDGGSFAHNDVPQMSASSSLAGGSATVATAVQGGGAETCTPADACQAGTSGSAGGEFGAWPAVGSYIAVDTKGTATTADDKVYVGDQERIQAFDSEGEYEESIPLPVAERTVAALAVDAAGNLYLALKLSEAAACPATSTSSAPRAKSWRNSKYRNSTNLTIRPPARSPWTAKATSSSSAPSRVARPQCPATRSSSSTPAGNVIAEFGKGEFAQLRPASPPTSAPAAKPPATSTPPTSSYTNVSCAPTAPIPAAASTPAPCTPNRSPKLAPP